ncbi:MurR/RpiR family transcriptional regulator [Herbiconiux liangxiaofengii]|uniref:MurR/RpiR family transcriptional regulator n=1 Tax=Herbiconiux liangxiaofengii TaxID=3342795 RepID=UPI0035B6E91C
MTAEATSRPESRTVLVAMRAAIPSLPPSERRVAEAFLDDPAAASALSIAELADACAVSTTSVVRFYRRIGYTRFKDLRMDLTREITRENLENASFSAVSGDIDRADTLEDIVSKVALNETLSISDTVKTLDIAALGAAVQAVLGAGRIDIFGVGASSVVGLDLQQKLSRIGRTALTWPDAHAAWTAATVLGKNATAIAISHSGDTVDTVEFLALAAASGAKTIAITNFDSSPLAARADVVLTTAARETRFRSGALGSRIAQLMVIDCLFTGVAQASYDESIEALRKTYAAVHSRTVG